MGICVYMLEGERSYANCEYTQISRDRVRAYTARGYGAADRNQTASEPLATRS